MKESQRRDSRHGDDKSAHLQMLMCLREVLRAHVEYNAYAAEQAEIFGNSEERPYSARAGAFSLALALLDGVIDHYRNVP